MNVMMAIRISGMGSPPNDSANTSLGIGHGSVVEIRTDIYPTRKQLKIKVSLSRNIHIMALPQGTPKTCLSRDQSSATPFVPGASIPLSSTASDIRTP
jgi:hypothetical protein